MFCYKAHLALGDSDWGLPTGEATVTSTGVVETRTCVPIACRSNDIGNLPRLSPVPQSPPPLRLIIRSGVAVVQERRILIVWGKAETTATLRKASHGGRSSGQSHSIKPANGDTVCSL
ncbi:hypothetical protein E2C01_086992 [Portunus trituberculatus]|uniref:Uncharacterized protein n=1 Tax=Portunus trituberculatus TaxID=210409 RepID=A0A5B7JEY8_PORTR|nr:hypothetical protein [Portunus trituberculatus]